MGEVAVTVDYDGALSSTTTRGSFHVSSFRVHSVEEDGKNSDGVESVLRWPGTEANPADTWLPITASRNGGIFSVVFHLVCSGIGFQALLLPVAFATLGWGWGITILSLAFVWQFYTIWLLVNLHESESESESDQSGARYSRYVHLSIIAFGEKLGKVLAIFPVMYLSGGTCAMLILTGGGAMQLFFNSLAGAGAGGPNAAEWFLVFTSMAILLAQFLPNLNSVARVSLIGSAVAVVYFTLVWSIPVARERSPDLSYRALAAELDLTLVEKFVGALNAVGIIVLSFRGHNLILEIQATLPSTPKQLSRVAMWRGVKFSYILIALCLFPVAIGGFWSYGNQISADEGMLKALPKIHGQNISKSMMCLIYILIVINSLSTFQAYAMVVFDNLESKYTAKRKQKCPRWLKVLIRFLFGCLIYFVAVAFPFLGSLAPLIGGLTMPLTFAYPCFMWLSIKKPQRCGTLWLVNVALGFLGLILCVLLVVAALWNLADKGLKANFFNP